MDIIYRHETKKGEGVVRRGFEPARDEGVGERVDPRTKVDEA
jgi:hypothetical protein